ncbi:hypothetical protein EYF80_023425 [Liparis tanakae]|uniref:Uncharacterized protein n=1 Tax=Liparis tanakae TaxID=230148 RepID=A0A4Z2HKS3_9TELE|nr:hypothetical protein EYF80_023425 [Liparis tanakae]
MRPFGLPLPSLRMLHGHDRLDLQNTNTESFTLAIRLPFHIVRRTQAGRYPLVDKGPDGVQSLTSVAPWESCWFTSSPCRSSSWTSAIILISVDARVSLIISWVQFLRDVCPLSPRLIREDLGSTREDQENCSLFHFRSKTLESADILLCNEDLDQSCVATGGSGVQRRPQLVVLGVDAGSSVQKDLHHLLIGCMERHKETMRGERK